MKKVIQIIFSSFLKLTLVLLAVTGAALAVAGSPQVIKQAISDSGAYDHIVSGALKESLEDDKQGNASQKVFIKAAQKALTPATIQDGAEEVIDGIHGWLDGKTETPVFKVDLSAAKKRFINSSADSAADHVAGLKACSSAQQQKIDNNTSVLDLKCRPPGLTPALASQQVSRELRRQDFLKDPVFTADTLLKDEDGRSRADSNPLQDPNIPAAYQRAQQLPLALTAISVILGVIVFLLGKTKRAGVKTLAITFASTGAVLAIFSLVTARLFARLTSESGSFLKDNSNQLHVSLVAVIRQLLEAVDSRLMIYGISYLIIGVATLLLLKFVWRQPAKT